ncbi:MAG: hypothetical protein PHF67_02805 [Candidatus Nanoarchaeia archaeon]|nr:hypothetical protein [Candidatus Nanoarchaeia archaeon]
MRKSKKSQALLIVAVLLVIFTLVLLAVVITVFFTKPSFVTGLGFPNVLTSKIVDERNYETNLQEITCNYPYIKVGDECCLDKDANWICDRDEQSKEVLDSCGYPYIEIGSQCCLDDNDNGICDKDDEGRTRIRNSDIDSPFDINSIDIEKDELSFDLENEGSEDVIIKKIKIDDCDTEHPDKTIEAGDDKRFNLDCDFYSRVRSDIEIEYMEVGSNETLTANGEINADFDYLD